jgi:predicted enzyme related to lactoylglutathione lyase
VPHAVTWFDISSNDPENLAAFYKKAFKWKIDPSNGNMIAAEKDGEQQGIAGSLTEAQGGSGGVTVYVTCPDIDSHLERVKAAGGTPLMPKLDMPGDMGSIATFSDPDGNTIGLWAPAAPKQAGKKAAKKSAKKAEPANAPKQDAAPKKSAKKAAKKAAKAEPADAPKQDAAPKKAPKKSATKSAKKASKAEPADAPKQDAAPKQAPKKAPKKASKKASKKAPAAEPRAATQAPAAATTKKAGKKAPKKKGKK